MMKKSTLLNIFIRSLAIQMSFNFWRMQNLGFAFAMLPMIRRQDGDPARIAASLNRHLQIFNTHPYMVAPVIGAVVRIEEEGHAEEAGNLKKTLMGPYAALGDSFFWGALRSFSAVAAVIVAFAGTFWAPFVFLLLYNPFHIWVRGKGFLEGYRRGRGETDFIRGLDLPGATRKIRLLLLMLIGVLIAVAVEMARRPLSFFLTDIPAEAAAVALFILFALAIRRGISPVTILYGTALLCMAVSF